MKKTAIALAASCALAACMSATMALQPQDASAEPASEQGTMLTAMVTHAKEGGSFRDPAVTVTDAQYNKYFEGGDAVQGVKDIIAAGHCYINGIAVPGNETSFAADFPDGYTVNDVVWLGQKDGKWIGGKNGRETCDTYADAAFTTFSGIPAGLEVRLRDADGDGDADYIYEDYKEAITADSITTRDDGSYKVVRNEPDASYSEGRVFDGQHFTTTSDEEIPSANFDTSIREGDVCLFWKSTDGWHLQRAAEVRGSFVDGQDHAYYQIDDVKYTDAMGFSRDNLMISNRNGEFTNVQKYFGFMNDAKHPVSLWLVPTSQKGVYGAPASITSGKNAWYFLYKAIGAANSKLSSVVVSPDGTDVATDKKWVTQEGYDQLKVAIDRAQTVLESGADGDLMDYQTYLLFLALDGGNDDIGAKYAGFTCTGFDNEIKAGTKVENAQPTTKAAAQKLKVSTAKKSVKAKQLKKKAAKTSAIKVRGAKTKTSFTKISGSKKLKVNAKTGVIVVKKGTKKGTYSIKVKVSAPAGKVKGTSYKAAKKTVIIKVCVK